MSLYRYVKKTTQGERRVRNLTKGKNRAIPILFVIVGVFFFLNAAYPVISYQLLFSPRFSPHLINQPSEAAMTQPLSQTISTPETPGQANIEGQEIDLLDLTKAANWFPQEKVSFPRDEVTLYHLSIPKLGIEDAMVSTGDDLKKNLVQYPGTAIPGRFGNTVIFGHSVLPQFFNPRNYLTIFSTLPTLKPKDEIFIDYNQMKYKYLVEQMIEVPPNDVSILAQRYDDSYLTLITCVPPGTYLKRLIVRARLTKI